MSEMTQTTERTARRIRHETKTRLLQVRDVSRITPKMVRIVVGGEALAGFVSAAHDDHVKLFFPQPGQDKPVLPTPSPNGPVYPEGAPLPAARDYTPRRYDAAANTLTIDFVIHGDGPATQWAAQARLGWFGRNTNLLNRYHGSYFFLAEILTEIEFAPAGEPYREHCGTCRRCLDLCPTGALTDGYRLEPRLCISYLTIEHRGPLPQAMRPLIGNWIFGCDVCQEVCPWNDDHARAAPINVS
jgi:ferredoxin